MATVPHVAVDGDGQAITISVIDNETGLLAAGFGSIVIALHDLKQGDSVVRRARFQWLRFKDANNNCAPMKMLVLATDPEADSG